MDRGRDAGANAVSHGSLDGAERLAQRFTVDLAQRKPEREPKRLAVATDVRSHDGPLGVAEQTDARTLAQPQREPDRPDVRPEHIAELVADHGAERIAERKPEYVSDHVAYRGDADRRRDRLRPDL